MGSRADLPAEFTAITGASNIIASQYLAAANWDLELAVSNYFDAGGGNSPPPFVPPVISRPPPIPLPQPPLPIPPLDDGDFPVITELKSGSTVLPLKALAIELTVNQYVAQVEVKQRFVNTESVPIEAVFTFQQEDVSIYEFYVEMDGKKIKSVCKEKEAAFNKYDDAIASGNAGVLLDKDTETEGKFKLNVGNLGPKAECTYAVVLATDGDALKVSVPITRIGLRDFKTPSDPRFPNGLSVLANVQMASTIFGIESESHDIQYEVNGKSATVSLKGDPLAHPAREFSFIIGLEDPHKTASSVIEVCEPSPGFFAKSTATMLCFYPSIEESDDDVLMEYVFLVDRSGSMSGSKNTQLKNALQLFLRSIPMGSLFNIVGFGTHFDSLFPSSVVYNEDSFARASQYVAALMANYGGTNILPPLWDILSRPPHPKFPRQLFILTDGEVDNTEEVITMAKKNSRIGSDASKRLVKGLARAGKGQAELVASGTRMEPRVLAQLKRAMQPHFAVEIEWGTLSREVKQAPINVPPAFPGVPIVVFGIIPRELTAADGGVAFKLRKPNGETQTIPVTISQAPSPGSYVGALAAAAVISDIEKKLGEKVISEQEAKQAVIPLALKYSLVTKFTSLVAEVVLNDAVEGTMEERRIGEDISYTKKPTEPPPRPIHHMPLPTIHYNSLLRQQPQQLQQQQQLNQMILPMDEDESLFGAPAPAPAHSAGLGGGRGGRASSFTNAKRETFQSSSPKSSARSQSYSSATNYFERYDDNDDDDSEEEQVDQSLFDSWEYSPSGASAAPASVSFGLVAPSPLTSLASTTSAPARVDPFTRPLDLFIVLQQAQGNWTLSPEFLNKIAVTQAQIDGVFGPLAQDWLRSIVATALAIIYLQVRFADSTDEWSLLKDKATRWATKELQKNNSTHTFEHFTQTAATLIKK